MQFYFRNLGSIPIITSINDSRTKINCLIVNDLFLNNTFMIID